jgi:hypothetical protein
MAISFARDIRPMFRPIDVDHMKQHGVLLDDFAYMSRGENDKGNARAVLETVVLLIRLCLAGTDQPQDLVSGFHPIICKEPN